MRRDEIYRLALDCSGTPSDSDVGSVLMFPDDLEDFARRLAAKERERCLRAVEGERMPRECMDCPEDEGYNIAVNHCAAAIRALEVA